MQWQSLRDVLIDLVRVTNGTLLPEMVVILTAQPILVLVLSLAQLSTIVLG